MTIIKKKSMITSMKQGCLLLVIGAILALVVAGCGGGHKLKTPQQLNGHQSQQQKVKKLHQSRVALAAIQSAPTQVSKTRACDSLPEGFGHMGVCAAAPAYLSKTVTRTVIGGNLGIDTSHWDHCGGVLAGPRFWTVAIGDGSYVDPCAGSLYASLRRAGIPRNIYYFTREYLGAIWSADHMAHLARQMGATDSLLPVNDAEAITSCSWIHSFDSRLKADLHLKRIIDYSSPGLWPGCSGLGNAAWTAAYGRIGQKLSGGSWSSYIEQQFTDGNVGPFPHCLAVCGDVDIATGNFNAITVVPTPPPNPIAYRYWAACSALDSINWWKTHTGHGHVSSSQHQQAVALRRALKRVKIGCSAPPHSYPYRYPQRKGSLA